MPSKIQSKNVDFCCAIFSCVCLHSERYKKLYIKRSFEVTLYHIAGETAYSVFKFQNMNIQCYFTQKCGVSDLGTRRIEFSTVQNVSLYRNILFCKFGQRR